MHVLSMLVLQKEILAFYSLFIDKIRKLISSTFILFEQDQANIWEQVEHFPNSEKLTFSNKPGFPTLP